MKNPCPRHSSHRHRGGITILAVLSILVLVTLMCFAMGRASIREMTLTGSTWQGAKASEAAEAGLDWFLLWTNPDNASLATGYRRQDLLTAFRNLNTDVSWASSTYHSGLPAWDRAAQLTSTPSDTSTDMVFDTAGAGYAQSNTNVNQSFDVFFRFLGTPPNSSMSSGAGSPAGQSSGLTGRSLVLYQVQSTGNANIATGLTYMNYQTMREMCVNVVP